MPQSACHREYDVWPRSTSSCRLRADSCGAPSMLTEYGFSSRTLISKSASVDVPFKLFSTRFCVFMGEGGESQDMIWRTTAGAEALVLHNVCHVLSLTKQELVEPVWCTPSALRASSRASSIGKSRSSISSSGCALNAHNDMFLKVLSGISACTYMHIKLPRASRAQ
jgi:hypothetical protein